MEKRKIKEVKYHDMVRDRKLEKDAENFRYLTSNRKFYFINRRTIDYLKKLFRENYLKKRILDYCCGEGPLTFLLAESGAEEVIGIDISSKSIEICREEALRRGLAKNTRFLVMDAEKMEFKDNYFDLIVCCGVLHHLDINKAYPELSRVLKPEGKVICNEPLIHNPVFHLYRKFTPQLRTEWEMNHILSRKDVYLAKKYFSKMQQIKFFHLSTLLAVPFRNSSSFNFILSILERIDSIVLRMPLIKWWAWEIVYVLSKPKNKN